MSRYLFYTSLAMTLIGGLYLAVQTSSLFLPNADASSHREAPLISKDPAVDNTDVYAFVDPTDRTKVTLIANWIPFEEPAGGPNFYHFDDNARYWIHVDNVGDGVPHVEYLWTFHTVIVNPKTFLYNTGQINNACPNPDSTWNYRQVYTVTKYVNGANPVVLGSNLIMPPDNIGPRSTPNYAAIRQQCVKTLANGYKEYTGQRADPFFVDVGSIFDLGGLRPFNSAHLIPLPQAPGQNNLHGFNVHTTALQAPISELVQAGCTNTPSDPKCVIGVWSTAERYATTVRTPGTESGSGNFVQVSRLGNPLVNEVVIDLARKDAFNAIPPTQDAVALDRVLTPELGTLIPVLYPGVTTPPPPRNDLVTVFLTGIPSLNQQSQSAAKPSEQLRLNTAISPTAAICAGNPLGVLAGDNAGFPNGRRLEDDVTDIEIRAVAGGYALTPSFNHPPNNALGDGVNVQDKPCIAAFPYMADPTDGYNTVHSAPQSITPPVVPELTPVLMLMSGLAGLGAYGLSRLRAGRERRRPAAA